MKNISECMDWLENNFLLVIILYCLAIAVFVGSIIYLLIRYLSP